MSMTEPNSDPAAERAVLAAIFKLGNEAYDDISVMVSPSTFTVDSNRTIYRCLEKVLADHPNAKPDLPLVLSAANSLGLNEWFDKQDERRHLRAVTLMPIDPDNATKLAAKISKLEIAREGRTRHKQAAQSLQTVTGDESIQEIISRMEEPIFDFTGRLAQTEVRGIQRMGAGAVEYLTHLMDNPVEMVGIPTPFPRFNRAIGGGLRSNAVDVIAGRLKVGKSLLVDAVGTHISSLGYNVLNVDTEMTKEEHIHRVAASMAQVDIKDIETGQGGKDPEVRKKILEAGKRLADLPYHYNCVIGQSFEQVLTDMRRWVRREVGLGPDGKAKPCVIIYDYLKLMGAEQLSGKMAEFQALGFLMNSLKNFMGKYGVACLCFAQVNREGIDREDSAVIAGSDRVGWFATSATLYKRKGEDEEADEDGPSTKYSHKMIPLFTRHGPGIEPGNYINIETDYSKATVREGPTRYELESSKRKAGFESNETTAPVQF